MWRLDNQLSGPPCPNSEVLGIVEVDFEREDSVEHEDASLFSVICGPAGSLSKTRKSKKGDVKIGAIDWEPTGLGRGSNGDIAQLLVHLHLFLFIWKYHMDGESIHPRRSCEAYRGSFVPNITKKRALTAPLGGMCLVGLWLEIARLHGQLGSAAQISPYLSWP